ncbi:hypothetical protein NQ318_020320 [Aromia moschata]|uniref:Odorant receptor n=1 Tax=Aromia moschata TaxID=1265417 RepID=A0AAV8XF91_9CUCU|nr:hypothetical protein NQ318_020320 [Aromia moschata]
MNGYAEDYFFLNRWILRCVGIWPLDNRNRTVERLYKAYSITMFLYFAIYEAADVVSLFYMYKNEDAFIKSLSMVATHLLGGLKGICFRHFSDKILDMIRTLESNDLKYEDCEDKNFFSRKTFKSMQV